MIIDKINLLLDSVKESGEYIGFYASAAMTYLLGNHMYSEFIDIERFKNVIDYIGAICSSLGVIAGALYTMLLLYVLIRDKVMKK